MDVNPPRTGSKRSGWIWAVLVILFVAFLLYRNGSSSSDVSPTPTSLATDPATMLAGLQAGGSVASGDPLITQFQSALAFIAPHCTQGKDRIAAMAAFSHDDLAKNGIDESYLSVLRHVGSSIQDLTSPTDCQSMFAAYLVIREPK